MLEDRLIQVENGIRQCRMMLDDLEKEVVVLKMACRQQQCGDSEANLLSLVGDPDKVRIIQKAMKKGLLAMTPSGHLHGLMRSKTLLAYFIGRLWSGDEVKNDAVTHEPIWVLRSSFPTKLVEDLFEEKGLRDLRKQRRNMPLPQGHELIDSLF
ncbi:MAG: hypothetical protein V8T35_07985 [Prevotella sp.]